MTEGRSVQIGDKTVHIEGFRAFKAMRAGEIVANISKVVPNLATKMGEYRRTYAEENITRLPRAVVEWKYPADADLISDEAWAACDNVMPLPDSPSPQQELLAIFPVVWESARDNVLDLLALLAVPNSELRRAAKESDQALKKLLDNQKEDLLFDAELPQLMDLAVASLEMVRDQFKGKGEELGNLLSLLGFSQEAPPKTTATEKPVEASSTQPNGKPDSSSASAPLATATTISSTESPGEPSNESPSN